MTNYDSIHDLLKEHLNNEETPIAKQLMNQMNFAKREGFFTMGFLYDIIDWKSPRSKKVWQKNDNEYVKEVSKRFFLLTDDKSRMACLRELYGVGIPVGSAILTVMDPKNYGVIDYHVWQTLFQFEYVTEKEDGKQLSVGNWLQFLAIIRLLAQQYEVTARDIERTLFNYHRD